ncbi:MAG: TIGR02450 family Trp-rich protein [Planctomycetota bacterium]
MRWRRITEGWGPSARSRCAAHRAHRDIELEAVHSGRTLQLHWRDMTDPRVWRQGWR